MEGAKDAMKVGMWCAILVAAFTTIFTVLAFVGIRLMGSSPLALIDALLFAGVAYGISKYSRVAAIVGFVLFVIEKIAALISTGSFLGVGAMGVVILIGLLNGVRGALAYHKLLAARTAVAVPPVGAPGV
jgi:hypothetical protein